LKNLNYFLLIAFIGAGIMFGVTLTLVYTSSQRAIERIVTTSEAQANESDNRNVQQVLDLKIPEGSEDSLGWQQYYLAVKALQIRDKRGRIQSGFYSTSPKVGLLALMAKRAPREFVKLLDRGEISRYTFSHFLDAGLLRDWRGYSDRPYELMLENSQALHIAALQEGDISALRRGVATAFFKDAKGLDLDMRSLAFAMPAMDDNEVQSIVNRLLGGTFDYDPRAVAHLDRLGAFTPEQLVKLVEHKAYSNKSMSSYQFEAVKWGSDQYLLSMAGDSPTNAKQPMNFYCAICTLVAFADGLVAQSLTDAVNSNNLVIAKENDGWVMKNGEVE